MFEKFVSRIHNPVLFRLFLLKNLPAAYFSGIRVQYVDQEKCVVTVPFKWFTKNPFRSTYFACLSMAAEMSTGLLASGQVYQRHPKVSMLVVGLEAKFFKKAVDTISFTCIDGEAIDTIVEESITTGESRSITCKSTGTNIAGDIVSEFFVTWSFKTRK